MKKRNYFPLVFFMAGFMLSSVASQCLSASPSTTPENPTDLSMTPEDTNKVVRKSNEQVERKAAAERMKKKGFKVKSINPSSPPNTPPQAKGGQ
jgi:hypothetical protein